MDVDSADRYDFVVGERYDIVGSAGREPFELVGLTRFGEDNAVAGAVLMSFTLDDVQRLSGQDGQIHWIDVAGDGVDTGTLVDRLNSALPADVESVSASVVVDEEKDDFGTTIDIFGNILLGFALVAVFVSTFIIGNTFNILLGQRVKQLALIRALGASRGQVRVSSMLEALIIGVVASILGLGGGVLLALGLRAVMNALGLELPEFDIIVSPRTVVAAIRHLRRDADADRGDRADDERVEGKRTRDRQACTDQWREGGQGAPGEGRLWRSARGGHVSWPPRTPGVA